MPARKAPARRRAAAKPADAAAIDPPAAHEPAGDALAVAWFASRGWEPFAFQREVWAAMQAGRSGLLHATTGSGKTYAVALGALLRAQAAEALGGRTAPPLRLLWITPMRALAADTGRALALPATALAPGWTVGLRSGDTPSAERARQDRRWPTVLVTTPESLSLMLTREKAPEELATVDVVVVDEWHELMGNKRGVQVQLALARLATFNPRLVVWGLSATLGNLEEAAQALLGHDRGVLVRGRLDKTLLIDTLLPLNPGRFSWAGHLGAQMLEPLVRELDGVSTALVFTNVRSQAEIWYQLILEARPEWAGLVALHHGSLAKEVRAWVEAGLKAGTLKVVVATSSLDLGVDFLPVERVLQIGSPKGIARLLQRAGRSGHQPGRPSRITLVPTHTMELVEAAAARRAAQAGRIERRATPDKPLDVLVQHLVTVALGGGFAVEPREEAGGTPLLAAQAPTGAGADIERDAELKAEPEPAAEGEGEGALDRTPAAAAPFRVDAPALFDEVRRTHAYRHLTLDEFRWALDFVERGGASLGAYPEYHRIAAVQEPAEEGGGLRARVPDRGIAKRHRLAVGTIVSDASMVVKWLSGGTIGVLEEGFVARLKGGDCFIFAGRVLEYVRTREMVAYVRKATRKKAVITSWQGSKMPLSSELADAVVALLAEAAGSAGLDEAARTALAGATAAPVARPDAASAAAHQAEGPESSPARAPTSLEPELRAAAPMLRTQQMLSRLPTPDTLLIERYRSREGEHLYLYPFAGRYVHMGLGSLLAWRLARSQPNTFSLSVNDYGFEMLSALPIDPAPLLDGSVLSREHVLEDVLASLNSSELAQRRFREIARVAGLIFMGYPGAAKSTRQLQASSSLFYEVFRKHDAGNLLLSQAQAEVLSQELDIHRLGASLEAMATRRAVFVELEVPSPMSLPLMVERFREKLSTEKLKDRLDRMLKDMNDAAERHERDGAAPAGARGRARRRARPRQVPGPAPGAAGADTPPGPPRDRGDGGGP